jgi:hypothetical protein
MLLLFIAGNSLWAQQRATNTRHQHFATYADSLLATEDSAVYFSLFNRDIVDTDLVSRLSAKNAVPHFSTQRKISAIPLLNGGYISYAANYRSIVDTPYAEKNIFQHFVTGQASFSEAGIPLQATWLIRRSNSDFFRNIQDFQISYDPIGWKSVALRKMREQIERAANGLENSAAMKALQSKLKDFSVLTRWLKDPFQAQRLIEANEIIRVHGITFKPGLDHEENQKREDSLKLKSERFLALYHQVDSLHRRVRSAIDSLTSAVDVGHRRAEELRKFSGSDITNYADYRNWQRQLQRKGLPDVPLDKKYERWMSVRSLSVGRTPLQSSELTAKNISINGVNFEYNSWYYAALSAGVVDFRFRDFAIGKDLQKQYLVMGRLGVGDIDNTHFIFSILRGRKQLFAASSNATGLNVINITAYSTEFKWIITNNSYMTTEMAQSISPDFSATNLDVKTRFNLSDFSNKAVMIKISSYYPKTRSRLEGTVKYSGANYQSFSSYQTNSETKNWYAKAEQYFAKGMFKLVASIRNNDYSNPYVLQDYSSNAVFKTINASFRKRYWPSISVGYLPVSQFTKVGDQISESRFESLSSQIYHAYKIGNTATATTVMFNKYFNKGSDSGYVYYNAVNSYWLQSIFLGQVTANLSISDTRNSQYQLQVFDEGIQFTTSKSHSFSAGVKINHYNRQDVMLGGYLSSSIRLWKNDILFITYDRGYLPGSYQKLIRNDMATIQFTKQFGGLSFKQNPVL